MDHANKSTSIKFIFDILFRCVLNLHVVEDNFFDRRFFPIVVSGGLSNIIRYVLNIIGIMF